MQGKSCTANRTVEVQLSFQWSSSQRRAEGDFVKQTSQQHCKGVQSASQEMWIKR